MTRGGVRQWSRQVAAEGWLAASSGLESRVVLAGYGLRWLRVLLLLAIWRAVLGTAAGGRAASMGLEAVLTYTLVAEACRELLSCRTAVQWSLWDGSYVTRCLRPMGLFTQFSAEALGPWVLNVGLFSLPLLLVAPWLGVRAGPAGAGAGLLAALSLGLGVGVGLALEYLFGAVLFYVGNSHWTVDAIRQALTVILSGALIPLPLMPWGLGQVLEWLPFASVASAPLLIYTGHGNPGPLLAAQLAWCLLLWPAATAAWRASRERMVPHGG